MEQMKVFIDTDWWMFFASILSGILAAVATLVAVILSNRETRKQLKQQQEQHRKELNEQYKASKFVIIKPTIVLTSFLELLDRIIIQNNYNRELLLTGEDGFDFFDDTEKRKLQICRILHFENESNNNITDIVLQTESCLEDRNTNELKRYKTRNVVKLLRPKESIDIRLANQEQYECILRMNNENTPSEFRFDSIIEYSTEAAQRITYCYNVKISNDRIIEIEKDEIEQIENSKEIETYTTTAFRNLQDSITIDRAAYVWEKMGQSQAKGIASLLGLWPMQQGKNVVDYEEKNEFGE